MKFDLVLCVTVTAAGIVPFFGAPNQIFDYSDTGEVYYNNAPRGQKLKLGWVTADKNIRQIYLPLYLPTVVGTFIRADGILTEREPNKGLYFQHYYRNFPEEASFMPSSLYRFKMAVLDNEFLPTVKVVEENLIPDEPLKPQLLPQFPIPDKQQKSTQP